MRKLLPLKLADEQAERVRRSQHDAITELQSTSLARAVWIIDVELANATTTPIAHGLGCRVRVLVSPPRGPVSAGWIEEIRDGAQDPTKYVVLEANGYGATVTVDLLVVPL